MPERETIPVPRALLIAGGVVLMASLAMMAFLLGRESGRKAVAPMPGVPAAAPAAPSPMAAPEGITPAAPAPLTDSAGGTVPLVPPGNALAPSAAASAPAAPSVVSHPATAVDPTGRAEVDRYFREAERIQSQGKYWSDPQALASTILEQSASGNSSEFDRLIETNRRVLAETRAMSVPAACLEHHRQTVALLEESVTLLARVKQSTLSGDAGSLLSLPQTAQELESRTRKADALAAEVKQRYGLK